MLFLILALFAVTALLLYLDSRKPKGFPPGELPTRSPITYRRVRVKKVYRHSVCLDGLIAY